MSPRAGLGSNLSGIWRANQAALLHSKGDHAAAEPLLREALAAQRETLGEEHADTVATSALHAAVLGKLEKSSQELCAAAT